MKQRILEFFAAPVRAMQEEQRRFLLSDRGRRMDYEIVLVFLTAAVAWTIQYYAFTEGNLRDRILSDAPRDAQLVRHGFWAVGQIVA